MQTTILILTIASISVAVASGVLKLSEQLSKLRDASKSTEASTSHSPNHPDAKAHFRLWMGWRVLGMAGLLSLAGAAVWGGGEPVSTRESAWFAFCAAVFIVSLMLRPGD